ncbi:MAG: hypothetical protein AAFV45_11670 [Pseudomonadota bacterium]
MSEANVQPTEPTPATNERATLFGRRRPRRRLNKNTAANHPPTPQDTRSGLQQSGAANHGPPERLDNDLPADVDALADQLSAVMCNKPQARQERSATDCEFLKDDLRQVPPPIPRQMPTQTNRSQLQSSKSDSQPDDHLTNASADETGLDHNEDPRDRATAPENISDKPWIKQARRKRWTSAASYMGAWLLTIGIGGFIIATASMIVLGPSQVLQKSKELWQLQTTMPLAALQPSPKSRIRQTAGSIAIVETVPKPFAVSKDGQIARATRSPAPSER